LGRHDGEVLLGYERGQLYHRLLHRHAPLSERFVQRVVDTALAGLGATPPAA